jgi:carboxyl-terminal processing protease
VPEEIKGRAGLRGESSLLGHLKGDGQEETGSQSYVPADPRNDKALNTAIDLMRGLKANPAFPPAPPVRGAAN